MKPLWSSLDTKVNSRTRAILMVHYFGQPQDIDKFLNFSKKHQLFLVEDNAHGHGGSFKGKELGTFGHIGISCPRKFLDIEDGGLLYLNSSFEKDSLPNLNYQEPETNKNLIRKYLNEFPVIKHKLKIFFKNAEIKNLGKTKHRVDPSGKSTVSGIRFKLANMDYAAVSLQCYDWSKKMKFIDHLRVKLMSKDYYYWILNKAYK